MSPTLSRRALLGAGAGLTVLGASGCSRSVSVNSDPDVLTLWYWTRSISEKFLDVARKQIPGTKKKLSTDAISDFDVKLRTSLAGGSYIPDITGVNSNVSIYFPSQDQFLDLNPLGASSLKADYFPWKWQFGVTPTDRMCFFPMDTGPTGFFYRRDLFEKVGFPTDPAQVYEKVKTWDAYLESGKEFKAKANSLWEIGAGQIFGQIINASKIRFFDEKQTPLFLEGDSVVKKAWDVAAKAARAGIVGKALNWNTGNTAMATGQVGAHTEAVWKAQVLKDTGPGNKGKWGVSLPTQPGNSGGSFLAIPKTCKDPEAAFAFIKWLNTPEMQVKSFVDMALFPSCPKSLESSEMNVNDPYFGNQNITATFYESAKQVPLSYTDPLEAVVRPSYDNEMTNIETQGKDPATAWNDATSQARKLLKKKGVQA